MSAKKIFFYSLILLIMLLQFIFSPLQGDQQGVFATSYYIDISGRPFPINVFESWITRPVAARLFYYGLYKVTTLFVSFANKLCFPVILLLIYGVLGILVFLFAIFSFKEVLRELKVPRAVAFLALLFAFFAVFPSVSMQPEHLSVLLIILALSLSINKSYFTQIIAGFILAVLFFVKGITVVLGFFPYIVLLSLGKKYRSNIIFTAFCHIFFLIAFIVLSLLFYPKIINEMLYFAQFQGNNISRCLNWHNFTYFIQRLPGVISQIPIIFPGILTAIVLFSKAVFHKQIKLCLFLLAIWLIPSIVTLAQPLGFSYFYTGLVLPSLVCIFLCFSQEHLDSKIPKRAVILVILFCAYIMIKLSFKEFLLAGLIATAVFHKNIFNNNITLVKSWFLFASFLCAAIWLIHVSPISYEWLNYYRVMEDERIIWEGIDRKFSISSTPEVLFLSDGTPTYYILSKSYCLASAPLPLQRSLRYPELKQLPIYEQTLKCILSYNGEFIINYKAWFPIEKFPEIDSKIKKEYDILEDNVHAVGCDYRISRREK